MAKEEMFLPEMQHLEIQPNRVVVPSNNENPFAKYRAGPRRLAAARCGCVKRSIKNTPTFKRNNHKLLKEPILKLGGKAALQATKSKLTQYSIELESPSRCPLQTLNLETLNVCALVDNDSQSSSHTLDTTSYRELQRSQNKESWAFNGNCPNDRSRGAGPSCSQQALNPSCDVTIDELASYFETLVHIPKKMSTMAEMMYI